MFPETADVAVLHFASGSVLAIPEGAWEARAEPNAILLNAITGRIVEVKVEPEFVEMMALREFIAEYGPARHTAEADDEEIL